MLSAAAVLLLLTVIYPEFCLNSLQKHTQRAIVLLVPSLFPQLALVSLISDCSASVFSKTKKRYTFLVLLSFFGGYVSGAKMLRDMCEDSVIDRKTASISLTFCVNSGSAFVITAVGTGIFRSAFIGILMFFSLVFASFLLMTVAYATKKIRISPCITSGTRSPNLLTSLSEAVRSLAAICSISIILGCMSDAAMELSGGSIFAACIACILEVTSGCSVAARVPGAPYLCVAAISMLSVSVFGQVSSVLRGSGISLRPLLISRLLHMPISLIVFRILMLATERYVGAVAVARPVPMPFSLSPFFTVILFLTAVALTVQKSENTPLLEPENVL